MFAVAFAAPLCGAANSLLHPPPLLYVDARIQPGELRVVVTAKNPLWQLWFDSAVAYDADMSDEQRAQALTDTVAFFTTRNPVRADGRPLVPTGVAFRTAGELEEAHGLPISQVELSYPLEAEPRQLEVLWESFEGTDADPDIEEPGVPMLITGPGNWELFRLTPDEPGYVWHRGRERRGARRDIPITGETSASPNLLSIPVGSIAALVVGVCALLLLRRRSPATGRAAFAGTAVAAVLVWPHARFEYALPRPPVEKPTGRQALTLFEQLHRGIYDAYQQTEEEEVYDALAQSVAPEILDELYQDVYDSLIMREEGGAISAVEKLEVMEGFLQRPRDGNAAPDDDLSFKVDWTWQVHGFVTHWGHTHRRVNQYQAIYTVCHDSESWKIAEVVPLSQRRVE